MRLLVLCLLSGLAAEAPFLQGVPSLGLPDAKAPAPIQQGPWGLLSSSKDPYWYQTGAIGTGSSSNYVGASVMIRTTYDQVNNDAHSYWVGGFIANGAFAQVGFLNEISTANQPYCCAWFFEYFYPPSSPPPLRGCCAPIIGREGSAGPLGSWHNYTMTSNRNGVWTFYMDGQKLGSTPDLGGTQAADSGINAPAAIAEVASASSNTDTLGPGEFKDLMFRTAGTGWQLVPSGRSFIWYGNGTPSNPPPNPYGAREVEGIDNDFLAGSNIPPLNNPTQPQITTPSLWPGPIIPCCISFTFQDGNSASLQPRWVSFLSSTGNPIFYTQYDNQPIEDGTWSLTTVMWHSTNIAFSGNQFTTPGTTSKAFLTNVFSIRLHLVGFVSGLPISGASVTTHFLDSVAQSSMTDGSGDAILALLPPSEYVIRVTVPFGIPAIVSQNVTGTTQLTTRVFGGVEVLLLAGVPISVAMVAVTVAISRERRRRATMPTIPPSFVLGEKCSACGQALLPGQSSCTNCGTMVKVQTT